MESNIETIVQSDNKESWLKRAFREEWPTMGNHLIACGTAITTATTFSHVAPEFMDSDAAIASIATVVDIGSYWGAFLPQLLYRDQKTFYDSEGNFTWQRVKRKATEYLGYMGVMEGIYATGRFFSHLYLTKQGWDHDEASLAIMLGATALFTGALPIIRYGVRQWSEK